MKTNSQKVLFLLKSIYEIENQTNISIRIGDEKWAIGEVFRSNRKFAISDLLFEYGKR